MAHFAQLDENNVVINVWVITNEDIGDPDNTAGLDNEQQGIDFITNELGQVGLFKQTSFNSNFRGGYAGIDWVYSEEDDKFYPPKPYDNWIFNEEHYVWLPPVEKPTLTDEEIAANKMYYWNQEDNTWNLGDSYRT